MAVQPVQTRENYLDIEQPYLTAAITKAAKMGAYEISYTPIHALLEEVKNVCVKAGFHSRIEGGKVYIQWTTTN